MLLMLLLLLQNVLKFIYMDDEKFYTVVESVFCVCVSVCVWLGDRRKNVRFAFCNGNTSAIIIALIHIGCYNYVYIVFVFIVASLFLEPSFQKKKRQNTRLLCLGFGVWMFLCVWSCYLFRSFLVATLPLNVKAKICAHAGTVWIIITTIIISSFFSLTFVACLV